MKKWKKILISLMTVFVLAILPAESAILPGTVCVTEAAPRISSSKLTDPYEILTQKDASEIANDTLDMAVPYWADLLKGSGITLQAKAWRQADQIPEAIQGQRIRLAYTPGINAYNGIASVELRVRDWEVL